MPTNAAISLANFADVPASNAPPAVECGANRFPAEQPPSQKKPNTHSPQNPQNPRKPAPKILPPEKHPKSSQKPRHPSQSWLCASTQTTLHHPHNPLPMPHYPLPSPSSTLPSPARSSCRSLTTSGLPTKTLSKLASQIFHCTFLILGGIFPHPPGHSLSK